MDLSEIEKEVIFLTAVHELIDNMVNYAILNLSNDKESMEIKFKTGIHQSYFYIILVDFLSKSSKEITGKKSTYLDALRSICNNPSFNKKNSIGTLAKAVEELYEWLEQEVTVKTWLPSMDLNKVLSMKRIDSLKICGNISKHNFSRLSGVTEDVVKILKDNDIEVDFQTGLLILDEFYVRFHDDINVYLGGTIAEFLNNIRLGIHEYLKLELSQSIVYTQSVIYKGGPRMYEYTYPAGVENKLTKRCYWDLMNLIRKTPCMQKFRTTRWAKLEY